MHLYLPTALAALVLLGVVSTTVTGTTITSNNSYGLEQQQQQSHEQQRDLQTLMCRCEASFENLYLTDTMDRRRQRQRQLHDHRDTMKGHFISTVVMGGGMERSLQYSYDYESAYIDDEGYYVIEGTRVLPDGAVPECGFKKNAAASPRIVLPPSIDESSDLYRLVVSTETDAEGIVAERGNTRGSPTITVGMARVGGMDVEEGVAVVEDAEATTKKNIFVRTSPARGISRSTTRGRGRRRTIQETTEADVVVDAEEVSQQNIRNLGGSGSSKGSKSGSYYYGKGSYEYYGKGGGGYETSKTSSSKGGGSSSKGAYYQGKGGDYQGKGGDYEYYQGKGGDYYTGKGKGGDYYTGKGKGGDYTGKGKGYVPIPKPEKPDLPPIFQCPVEDGSPTSSPTSPDPLAIATTCPDGSVGPIDPESCTPICPVNDADLIFYPTIRNDCRKACPTGPGPRPASCVNVCEVGTDNEPFGCVEKCCDIPKVCPYNDLMPFPLEPENCGVACVLGSEGTIPVGCVDFCTGQDTDSVNCIELCESGSTSSPTDCREMCCEEANVCPDDPSMFEPVDIETCGTPCVDGSGGLFPVGCTPFCTGNGILDADDCVTICDEGTLLPEGCEEMCCATEPPKCPLDSTMNVPLDPDNCAVECAPGSTLGNLFPVDCVTFCTGDAAVDDGSACTLQCEVGTLLPIGCREMCCEEEPEICLVDPSMPVPLDPESCAEQCIDENNDYPVGCVNFCDDVDTDSTDDDCVVMCDVGTFLPIGCQERCCKEPATYFPTAAPVLPIADTCPDGTIGPFDSEDCVHICTAAVTTGCVPLCDDVNSLACVEQVCDFGVYPLSPQGCTERCCEGSAMPSVAPTASPTPEPTPQPTVSPTLFPTKEPTPRPTPSPTRSPTKSPTRFPTPAPTKGPTRNPTPTPTKEPTRNPTPAPTRRPTRAPTNPPTDAPAFPTAVPTAFIIETCPLGEGSVPRDPENCVPRCPTSGPKPVGCAVFCPTDGSPRPFGCISECPTDGSPPPLMCREPCCEVEVCDVDGFTPVPLDPDTCSDPCATPDEEELGKPNPPNCVDFCPVDSSDPRPVGCIDACYTDGRKQKPGCIDRCCPIAFEPEPPTAAPESFIIERPTPAPVKAPFKIPLKPVYYGKGKGGDYYNGKGGDYYNGKGGDYYNGKGSDYYNGKGSDYYNGKGSDYYNGKGSDYYNGKGSDYNNGKGSDYYNGKGGYYYYTGKGGY